MFKLNEKNLFNYLNNSGIVKLGIWVEEGDILVGKVFLIGIKIFEKKLLVYEKLLYDIIGKFILKIKDILLCVLLGIKGCVVYIELIEKEIFCNFNILDNNNLLKKYKIIIKNKNFFIYKFLKKKNFYLKYSFKFLKLNIEKLNLFFENKLLKLIKNNKINNKIKKKFYLNGFYNFYYKLNYINN